MNIRLPKEFTFRDEMSKGYAYVKNGVLHIHGTVNFERLMYQLTYELRGKNRCYYCGKNLNSENRSLDHVYPRNWGGITITNNLLPCCKNCNQTKMDMTYKQFRTWQKIKLPGEKDKYLKEVIEENFKVIKSKLFLLPSRWLRRYEISEMVKYINLSNISRKKNQKLSTYFNAWHQYPYPIIVSSNGWLFKGKPVLWHAKKHKKKYVTAVVLDNVIVHKNSSF